MSVRGHVDFFDVARTEKAVMRAVEKILHEEAKKIGQLAIHFLNPRGDDSISKKIADELVILPLNKTGSIINDSAAGVQIGVAGVGWHIVFDHPAAHKVHQQGRTKDYLNRAAKAREAAIQRRIDKAVRTFRPIFQRHGIL